MAATEPKMRSITGKLTPNELTEREDDFTCNVIYQAKRTIKDLCQLTSANSKFTASELEIAYNDLKEQAKIELYNASTVEFGFVTNSLGVDGPFIGPDAKFDPAKNNVVLRSVPLVEMKKDLGNITVIISGTAEGLPVITTVTDVTTGSENNQITPGGGLNGKGNRVKIAGEEGKDVGFYFVSTTDDTETKVPVASLLRNDPSYFSFIIPPLAAGTYYQEIATQASGNAKILLNEPRRNRFPYILTVGGSDRPEIE